MASAQKGAESIRPPEKSQVIQLVGQARSEDLMPDLYGLSMRAAFRQIAERRLEIKVDGRGVVIQQTPVPGIRIRDGDVCHLKFGPAS